MKLMSSLKAAFLENPTAQVWIWEIKQYKNYFSMFGR